jgi:ProP effector
MSTTLRMPAKVRLDLTTTADPAPIRADQPAKKRKRAGGAGAERIPPKVHNAEQQQRKAAEVAARTTREMAEANERRAAARAGNVAALAERFPVVFGDADKPAPLAIGCANAVRAALAMTWSQSGDLMHWWTHRPAYYQALIAGGPRYNLDGTVDGEVTPHQQAHATKALRRHQNWLASTTVPPEREAEIAARADAGESIRAIARDTGFQMPTIALILRNARQKRAAADATVEGEMIDG